MKKILAVVTALALAISSLCVFVVATSGALGTLTSKSETLTFYLYDYCSYSAGDSLTVTVTLEGDSYFQPNLYVSGSSGTVGYGSIISYGGEAVEISTTATATYSSAETSSGYAEINVSLNWMGDYCTYVNVTNISVVNNTTSSSSSTDYTFPIETKELGSSGWGYTYDSTTGEIAYEYGWAGCGWWLSDLGTVKLDSLTITTGNEIDCRVVIEYMSTYEYDNNGTTATEHYSMTVDAVNGVITASGISDYNCDDTTIYQIYIQCKNDAGTLTIKNVDYTVPAVVGAYTVDFDSGVTLGDNGTAYGTANEGDTITFTISKSGYTVVSWTLYDASGTEITSGTSASGSFTMPAGNVSLTVVYEKNSSSGVTRFIYVNEEYHALIIYRNGSKHLISLPHTDENGDGYCDVCKMYVTEAEEATITIDGVEYVELYAAEVGIDSNNDSRWGQLDLGDASLIDALTTEGSVLVITRDGVSDTVYSDNSWEKFGLVNSWWSGTWIALGTAGTTSDNEADIVNCTSDNGTTVIYDGATVYAEWVARGMNAGGNVVIISNSSNDLVLATVQVLVPVGSVVAEDVEVDEPQEDSNTETEEDGDDVDVNDTDDTEEPESNPTTGVVLALVPMAIAGLAVVASKRR